MPKISSTLVNRTLAAEGHEERLVPGDGYWYFTDGDTPYWPATMVCVPRITDLSLDEWLEEHRTLAARSW